MSSCTQQFYKLVEERLDKNMRQSSVISFSAFKYVTTPIKYISKSCKITGMRWSALSCDVAHSLGYNRTAFNYLVDNKFVEAVERS